MTVKARTEKNFRRARPLKPVRKRAAARRWPWRVVGVGAVGMVALFATYRAFELVMHASVLQVRRIVVRGNDRLSTGEVQALVHGLRGTSILSADLTKYRDRLMESPWVADVALRRVLPSTIEVFISERRPLGLCRIGSQLYLLDRSASIIDEYGPKYAQFDLPIIDGAVSSQSGAPVVDEQRAALAARVIDELAGHPALAARVSQIDVADPRNAIVLLDDDPALLHLGTEQFASRLQRYVEVAATLRESAPEIEYVELRFGERIYVRPIGSAVVQAAGRPPVRN